MSSDIGLKERVIREAAALLYFGAEKEYKQAKMKAGETYGTHFLPSNLEVALELNRLAEEKEGSARNERLIFMRKEALKIMKILEAFHPLLLGSVWRGTIHQGSDIDIAVYAETPENVVNALKANNFMVQKNVWETVNKHGKTLSSFHINGESEKTEVEIVVRRLEEVGEKRKCEVFGDLIKGLRIPELEKVLKENPLKQFLP
jgi:predicted nucleotidyltransferase